MVSNYSLKVIILDVGMLSFYDVLSVSLSRNGLPRPPGTKVKLPKAQSLTWWKIGLDVIHLGPNK